jgi:hypothetical protein
MKKENSKTSPAYGTVCKLQIILGLPSDMGSATYCFVKIVS